MIPQNIPFNAVVACIYNANKMVQVNSIPIKAVDCTCIQFSTEMVKISGVYNVRLRTLNYIYTIEKKGLRNFRTNSRMWQCWCQEKVTSGHCLSIHLFIICVERLGIYRGIDLDINKSFGWVSLSQMANIHVQFSS